MWPHSTKLPLSWSSLCWMGLKSRTSLSFHSNSFNYLFIFLTWTCRATRVHHTYSTPAVECGGALYLCSVSHSISRVPPWCCASQPLPLPLHHYCARSQSPPHSSPLWQVAFYQLIWFVRCCFFVPQLSCSETTECSTLIKMERSLISDTQTGFYSRSGVAFERCDVSLECCSSARLLQRWCFSPYSRLNKGQYLFIVGHLQPSHVWGGLW